MRLGDRLAKGQPAAPERLAAKASTAAATAAKSDDPLSHLKQRTSQALFARLGSRLYDSSMSESQLQQFVNEELSQVVELERSPLTPGERQRLAQEVSNDVLGYGPIQQYLEDRDVTEIMINSTDMIYVERKGKLHRTASRFVDDMHLRRVIERIVGQVGRRIDESAPMVDARLPDGSRVNAVIPPLAVHGPALTIRKFAADPLQVPDLVEYGTLTEQSAEFLAACVEGKLNVLVTGGTGTGKTTMLNVLSGFIPTDERIVTIEDAVELQLHQDHVVTLESRPPNIEGRGEVTIRDLVRNSLRMRPDRIIVGEARGSEALDMLQAMNTGHEGSLSTLHANSPRDALSRLETMVLMAGMELPVRAIREQISSALDLIVHLSRLKDGSRRITQVAEIQGMEGDIITLQDIYSFDFRAGMDEEGRFRGQLVPTGIRPGFTERLADQGVELPAEVFGNAEMAVTAAMLAGRRSAR
jgi:pilus assembly protein CpaF